MITVKEVKTLALKHYNNGGDVIAECWNDEDIQKAINEGFQTKDKWIELFDVYYCEYLDTVSVIR